MKCPECGAKMRFLFSGKYKYECPNCRYECNKRIKENQYLNKSS